MGLTDIMRLNNLSGYVNDLIPRKRLSVQHILQNDARVCIANEIQRAGSNLRIGASGSSW